MYAESLGLSWLGEERHCEIGIVGGKAESKDDKEEVHTSVVVGGWCLDGNTRY